MRGMHMPAGLLAAALGCPGFFTGAAAQEVPPAPSLPEVKATAPAGCVPGGNDKIAGMQCELDAAVARGKERRAQDEQAARRLRDPLGVRAGGYNEAGLRQRLGSNYGRDIRPPPQPPRAAPSVIPQH